MAILEVSEDVRHCVIVCSEGIPRGVIVGEDHLVELLAHHLQHGVEVVPLLVIGKLLNLEDVKDDMSDDRVLQNQRVHLKHRMSVHFRRCMSGVCPLYQCQLNALLSRRESRTRSVCPGEFCMNVY